MVFLCSTGVSATSASGTWYAGQNLRWRRFRLCLRPLVFAFVFGVFVVVIVFGSLPLVFISTFFSGIRHFPPRISDRAGWYLRSCFQFSVGLTVRTYTTNVPTLKMFLYLEFREQRPRFDRPPKKVRNYLGNFSPGNVGISLQNSGDFPPDSREFLQDIAEITGSFS